MDITNNDAFVNNDLVKFEHPDNPSVWVELKAELTGHEERKRDALASSTEARIRREMSAEEVKEARKKAKKKGRLGGAEEVEGLDDEVEVVVDAIKAELDMYDLIVYVKGWSFPKPVGRKSFERLKRPVFNWLLTVIDDHRRETVLMEDEEKNSNRPSSSTSPVSPSPATSAPKAVPQR